MTMGGMPRVRRLRARALGTSALALAASWTGTAAAQCAPEPTAANGTTTCTGTDLNGLTVSTYGTRVVVPQGATVQGANGAPAVAVRITSAASATAPIIVNVAGRVDGGIGGPGVSLVAQQVPGSGFIFSQTLNLVVGAGGVVTGTNGVVVGQAGQSPQPVALVSVDNAGTIASTVPGGAALLSTVPASYSSPSGFSSIINRAGGRIGAIVGAVGSLSNAGTIDGGAASAVDGRGVFVSSGSLINTGAILSAGTAATITDLPLARQITNSGTIANAGTGLALSSDTLNLSNAAGARITTAGALAIRTSDTLRIQNAGTIDGSVLSGTQNGFGTSFVDSVAGRINGALTLGGGNDTLVAVWRNGQAETGITGAVNGGGGTDVLRVRFDANAVLASPAPLPVNFERLALVPDAGVTATLAPGFSAPAPILLSGAGTVVNRTALAGTTQVIAQGGFDTTGVTFGTLGFVNQGTITASAAAAGQGAVTLGGAVRFENASGASVGSAGDAVFMSGGTLVNAGTITATGTGTGAALSGTSLTNTGTIRSTSGMGVTASFNTSATNTGRIEGVVAGLRLGGTLFNTGTITGTQNGVLLDDNAVVANRAGGTISGGTVAVTPPSGFGPFNAVIANAGTINGNVTFVGSTTTPAGSSSANRYFALPGGVLNGNLSLKRGDTLVAELAGSTPGGGAGAFAGITGQVTGTDAALRLRVRGTAAATATPPAGFAAVGYELVDGAALTLTGGTAPQPVLLAGRGSADVTVNLAVTDQAALTVTSPLLAPGETFTANALAVTSRGALSLTRTGTGNSGTTVQAAGSSFTNVGTVTAISRNTGGLTIAVSGGSVTNTGSILLDGSTGIYAASSVTNAGSIAQVAGAQRAATGVEATFNPLILTNSGTIDVGGLAVTGNGFGLVVNNGGRIASSGTVAIRTTSVGGTITNTATGNIAGTGGTAVQMAGGQVTNAGTIMGSVNLAYSGFGQSFAAATYVADGGTVAGDLLFGSGADTLVSFGTLGVSGQVNGGAGIDTFVQARRTSGDVTLSLPAGITGFERLGARAVGTDTVVTLRAAAPVAGVILVSGDGGIVNAAELTGAVRVQSIAPNGAGATQEVLGSFTNQSSIRAGFSGATRAFTNAEGGVLGTDTLAAQTVQVSSFAPVAFDNRGRILNNGAAPSVALDTIGGGIVATNAGTIAGGFNAAAGPDYFAADDAAPLPASVSLANTGTVTASSEGGFAVNLSADADVGTTAAASLTNSGLIEATGRAGVGAGLSVGGADDEGALRSITVANTGTIRANAGGIERVETFPGGTYRYTDPAGALLLTSSADGPAVTVGTVTNSGTIEATGARSSAIGTYDIALNLTNSGTVRGTAGTALAADDVLIEDIGRPFLAGAIQVSGAAADRVLNTGAIIGSVDLGAGDDRYENRGRQEGDVFLGEGADTFVQLASATLTGTVDAGEGDDLFTVDASGGGAVNGDQFVNFERFSQVGTGNVAYSGRFRFDTITQAGGTLTVARGQTLATDGPTTVTGTDAAETVENDGTISGNVSLLGSDDRVVNRGVIGGSVFLGAGDDTFVDAAGSRVGGTVDGGAGTDLYTVVLSGDRTGIGARTGFERLAVRDAGTLTLTLDQDFEQVRLVGSGLTLTQGGFRVGRFLGSEGAERLTLDGDAASVALAEGDDRLQLGASLLAGTYDGGAGTDVLRLAATGPVTLSGTAIGFERVDLAGGQLTVSGTLGSAGAPLSFGEGTQSLTVARGGTLAGAIDLGAGDDALRLAAGSTLAGTVAGGAGTDTAVLELAGDRALSAGTLTGFERLGAEGSGTLTLSGTQAYERVDATANLAVAAGGSLASAVRFGAGDQRFTVVGGFAGSVDGGAGTDTVTVSGGTEAAPVAFSSIANVEAFAMTGGFATVSGAGVLGSVDLSGGRLVGLSGSTLTAAQFVVRAGATFGSAGTVNGNLQVAGTLSPGASPGTMTVNGNVALAAGSVSLFELTPTVSDRLVVNGAVSIAPGATLRLVTTGTITPGTSFELVTASAGITGSYSNVERPASLFGALVQDANRIRLLGQFLAVTGAAATPQVARSVAYANAVIASGRATPGFLVAVPALLGANGASNAAAFARLTPEPYATATQAGVDDALALVSAARGPAFASGREDPGLFTFGQGLAGWHRLGADQRQGSSAASSRGYGFLGGIGYGSADWSAGVFAGYLDTHQSVGALGARTSSDGFVAGAHARWAPGALKVTASVLYDGGDATTRRAVPGGTAPVGSYGLKSWVSDLSASYALGMGTEWALSPRVGVTYLRTTRGAVAEAGSPFALTVARDRHRAGFADAGLGVGRAEASDAAFRPYVSLGVRYQLEGRRTDALASYGGGPLDLVAVGAQRARAVATAAAGLSMRVTEALDLFSTVSVQQGRDDNQEAVSTGLRLRF